MVAINVTSLGYRGSIDEVSGAKYFARVGSSSYGVADRNSFAAAVTTGDRMLRFLAGTAWAHNIVDQMHTTATVQLNAVASGQRWDLIVLRRDTTTSTTTLEVIEGTSTKAIPARPATSHPDQPLYLARVTAGQTTVQELVDLRVWASNGGATARDPLVLSYLDAEPGGQIEINGVVWQRRINSGGTADEWIPLGGQTTFHTLDFGGYWDEVGGLTVTHLADGIRRVDLSVTVKRSGPTANYTASAGWIQWTTSALPEIAKGSPVNGTANALQFYSPLYSITSTAVDPSFARFMVRLVPATGDFRFINPGASSSYSWATGLALNLNASYFVR